MKIELCEDNGFLNNGKPTLVVLVIDGKIRIPYEATKTIQELYVDVQKMNSQPVTTTTAIPFVFVEDEPIQIFTNNEIEREDIIKCHRLEKDVDGNVNDDLEIGKEYRVIDIYKSAGKVTYYELLDDEKDDKIRIPCLPSEIELVKKHEIKEPKKQIFDTIVTCDGCKEQVALLLEGDTYTGSCEKCGKLLTKARP